MDPSLLLAYRNAIYIVQVKEQTNRKTGSQRIALKIGSTNERLDDLFSDVSGYFGAFLTASNPRSKCLSVEENECRSKRLRALLKAQNFTFLEGYSTDPDEKWPKEESFLIFNLQQEEATAIGREFEQNAYLWLEKGKPVKLNIIE